MCVCRYKVRSEIARKQKESESKSANHPNQNYPSNGPNAISFMNSHPHLNTTLDRSFNNGVSGFISDQSLRDEIQRLQILAIEQEEKWRNAYSELGRENEDLRKRIETLTAIVLNPSTAASALTSTTHHTNDENNSQPSNSLSENRIQIQSEPQQRLQLEHEHESVSKMEERLKVIFENMSVNERNETAVVPDGRGADFRRACLLLLTELQVRPVLSLDVGDYPI